MHDAMRRDLPVLGRDLDTRRLLHAGVHGDVALAGADNVGREYDPVLAAVHPGLVTGAGQGNVRESGREGDVSIAGCGSR